MPFLPPQTSCVLPDGFSLLWTPLTCSIFAAILALSTSFNFLKLSVYSRWDSYEQCHDWSLSPFRFGTALARYSSLSQLAVEVKSTTWNTTMSAVVSPHGWNWSQITSEERGLAEKNPNGCYSHTLTQLCQRHKYFLKKQRDLWLFAGNVVLLRMKNRTPYDGAISIAPCEYFVSI